MTIIKESADRKGVHDLHHRMCNRFMMNNMSGVDEDGCHEIIGKAIAPFDVTYAEIPDPINVFMNYPYDLERDGFFINEPITKAGDYIEFRAEMDVLVALANCPEDSSTACNGGGTARRSRSKSSKTPMPSSSRCLITTSGFIRNWASVAARSSRPGSDTGNTLCGPADQRWRARCIRLNDDKTGYRT